MTEERLNEIQKELFNIFGLKPNPCNELYNEVCESHIEIRRLQSQLAEFKQKNEELEKDLLKAKHCLQATTTDDISGMFTSITPTKRG